MWRKILIGVLLSLTAVVLAAGVWSYWWTEALLFGIGGGRVIEAGVTGGAVAIGVCNQPSFKRGDLQRFHIWSHDYPRRAYGSGFLFRWDGLEKAIGLPFWLIAAGLLLVARRVRRRNRKLPGTCVHCGYDLRATPEGGAKLLEICPECGTARTAPAIIQ